MREPSSLSDLAVELVRDAYEATAALGNLDLNTINSVRPENLRYDSIQHLVRESLARANAVSNFAVELGLITPEKARDIVLDFYAAHPEMREDD